MKNSRVVRAFRKTTVAIASAALLAASIPAGSAGSGTPSASAASLNGDSCPAETLKVALNGRVDLSGRYALPRGEIAFSVGNPAIARVSTAGVVVPLAAGATNVTFALPSSPTACVVPLQVGAAADIKLLFAPKSEVRTVSINGKSFTVRAVTIPKGMPVDIGLPNDVVGSTGPLLGIAQKRKAEFAVNGTFFNAYDGVPDPWGTIIADGELAHLTNMGTAIGFEADGRARMDSLRVKIEGGINGSFKYPNYWYAFFVNRTPSATGNAAVLFTPKRGSRIGFARGTAVVVADGKVTKIVKNENAAIPKNGFVLVFTGTEQYMAGKFKTGDKVQYRLKYTNAAGETIPWNNVITAIGAGPRLVTDGAVKIDAKKEGFTQDKILTGSAARSGIGIRSDGSVIVVTSPGATIHQLAYIMVRLGAKQAMNLDGGASSGLYGGGKLLTTPGRELSNTLVFGRNMSYRP